MTFQCFVWLIVHGPFRRPLSRAKLKDLTQGVGAHEVKALDHVMFVQDLGLFF